MIKPCPVFNIFTMSKTKLYLSYLLIWTYCLFIWNEGNSQSVANSVNSIEIDVSHILIEEGFQSIVVYNQDNKLIVSYENRRYRFEVAAILRIMELLTANKALVLDEMVLVPKRRNIPILSVSISLKAYQQFKNKETTIAEFAQYLSIESESIYTTNKPPTTQKHTGNYALELEVEPQLRLAFGGNPDAVVHQLNLVPRVNLFLWKGAKLSTGVILPISNEFQIEEEDLIRPELIVFSQYLRLPGNTYAGLSAGYFTKYRYGTQVEVGKFFLNNNLLIKGKIGYTGYASYPKRLFLDRPEKGWQRANLDYIDYQIGMDYRVSKWDLVAGIEYGKGLFDKRYIQANLSRQIKEMTIGFVALKTDNGENYGVRLSLPIFPKKYWKPKRISVRPAHQFKYDYNGNHNFVTQYSTRTSIADLHFQLNPSFIKNQLLFQLTNQ